MSRFETWLCLGVAGAVCYLTGGVSPETFIGGLFFTGTGLTAHWLANRSGA